LSTPVPHRWHLRFVYATPCLVLHSIQYTCVGASSTSALKDVIIGILQDVLQGHLAKASRSTFDGHTPNYGRGTLGLSERAQATFSCVGNVRSSTVLGYQLLSSVIRWCTPLAHWSGLSDMPLTRLPFRSRPDPAERLWPDAPCAPSMARDWPGSCRTCGHIKAAYITTHHTAEPYFSIWLSLNIPNIACYRFLEQRRFRGKCDVMF
jgi:hypothetical protein